MKCRLHFILLKSLYLILFNVSIYVLFFSNIFSSFHSPIRFQFWNFSRSSNHSSWEHQYCLELKMNWILCWWDFTIFMIVRVEKINYHRTQTLDTISSRPKVPSRLDESEKFPSQFEVQNKLCPDYLIWKRGEAIRFEWNSLTTNPSFCKWITFSVVFLIPSWAHNNGNGKIWKLYN